jgi:hypothetical protein
MTVSKRMLPNSTSSEIHYVEWLRKKNVTMIVVVISEYFLRKRNVMAEKAALLFHIVETWVQISARRLSLMTEIFHGFP